MQPGEDAHDEAVEQARIAQKRALEAERIDELIGQLLLLERLEAGEVRAKLLANFGVGYNHIDVAAARSAGLEVTNTPGAVTDATADIAMTLILMSARRAAEGERLVRAGRWTGWHPTQMLGLHVSGKVLGVVGMGRIGKAIARRAALGSAGGIAAATQEQC